MTTPRPSTIGDDLLPRGWFDAEEAAFYREEASKIRGGLICEIGVYLGRSLSSIAAACRENRTRLVAIDNWRGCVEIGEQLRGIAGSLEPEMRVAVLRSECELSVRLGIAAPRTILALARRLRVVGRAEEAAQMLECAAELAAMHHGPEHRVTRRIASLLSDQKGA